MAVNDANSPEVGSPLLVRIGLPPGFAGLPITADRTVNEQNIMRLAEEVSHHIEQPVAQAADHIAFTAATFADQGVRLFGRFATRVDSQGQPVLATLALAIPELAGDEEARTAAASNRTVLVSQLAKRYRDRHQDGQARPVELAGSGLAMAAARSGEFRIAAGKTGQTGAAVRPAFIAEYQIPSPDYRYLVVLNITTGSSEGWEAVFRIAAGIADSVSFENPEPL